MASSVREVFPRSSDINLEEINAVAGLEAIAAEWGELWERCPAATPFQKPEWLLPWLHHVYRGGDIRVPALRSEGRLIGLAPMFIHRHWRDFEVRQVSFIGAGISDYLDILVEPDFADSGTLAILQYLAEHRSRWDICHFQELRADSPLLALAFPADLHCAVMPAGICPVLKLPENMPLLRAGLPAKFRTDLRRAGNRLRNSGDVTFETATAESLPECLDALFRLHAARWELREQAGVLAAADIRSFHREVAAGFLRSGELRVHALRHRGVIAAIVYSFVSRGRAYVYLGGFDPELARFSPGSVLLEFGIESALAERASEYDFLRKKEEYKHQWGACDCANRRILLWHSGSRLPSPGFPEDEPYEHA